MKRNSSYWIALILAAGMCMALESRAAIIINNGTFESWGTVAGTPPAGVPTDWTQSSTFTTNPVRTAGLVNGSNYAALIRPAGVLNQSFSSALTQMQMDFVLAATDPGSSSNRSFNMAITTNNSSTTNLINLRMIQGSTTGLLSLEAFNGSGWTSLAADAFQASTYNSSSNSFSVLNAYNFSLTLSLGTTSSYSITYGLVDGTTTTINNIAAFQTAYTVGGTGATGISLMGSSSSTSFALDNLNVVPEPGPVALLGMGILLIVSIQSRKRRTNSF